MAKWNSWDKRHDYKNHAVGKRVRWSDLTPVSRTEADILFPHTYNEPGGAATLIWTKLRREWNRRGLFFGVDDANNLWCCLGGLKLHRPERRGFYRAPVSYDRLKVDAGTSNVGSIDPSYPPRPSYIWRDGDWKFYSTEDGNFDFDEDPTPLP